MEKVIVSGLLIIASAVAAVIAVTAISSTSVVDQRSMFESNRVATNYVGTGIEGLSAVVEGRNGAVVSAWFKNVGSADIKPVSAMDVFLLSGNRFSGTYIEFSSPPSAIDSWSVLDPAGSVVWARGETIHIRLVLNARPMATGAYIISLTTPNGVSGEIHLEHWEVPRPPGLSLSKSAATVNERGAGSSDTFTIALDSSPWSSVTLSVSSSDVGEVIVSPADLTFTGSNWSSPQTVTLTGVDESTRDGRQKSDIIVSVVDALSAVGYRSVGDSTLVTETLDNGCCP